MDNNIGNQNKNWKNIQDVLPSKKKAQNSTIELVDKISGQQIHENETASYINDFFVNIGPNLASKCNTEWKFRGTNCDQNIENISTNIDEILRLSKEININKASCI